ncbi:hypothetical protein AAEX28_03580 [Lentisphaerota bacterium WC36G]|nr:hypothetical protein LJT99_06455 [Lentisphaerae bacterium WC36]
MSVFYLRKGNSKLGPISKEKIFELYENKKINLEYSVLTEDTPPIEYSLAEFCGNSLPMDDDTTNNTSFNQVNSDDSNDNDVPFSYQDQYYNQEPVKVTEAHSATGIKYANQVADLGNIDTTTVNVAPQKEIQKPTIEVATAMAASNAINDDAPAENKKQESSKVKKKGKISINFRKKRNGYKHIDDLNAQHEADMQNEAKLTPPPIPVTSSQNVQQYNTTSQNIENNTGYVQEQQEHYSYLGGDLGAFHISESEMIVCSHCWNKFPIEDLLFISQDYNNLGDPIAGAGARNRFKPSSFDNLGRALDHNGIACDEKACPVCHLKILDSNLDLDNVFYSIVGAPACGKSYLLSSMIYQFRDLLSKKFAMTFTDADAKNNMTINNYIETLFYNSMPDKLVSLPKTEIQGNLYNQINWHGSLINLPIPFVFTLQSSITERNKRYDLPINVTFYDNAGEHFQPGMDDYFNPGTKHLGNSEGIMFCFDVSKELRIVNQLNVDDPQLNNADFSNQTTLFTEMASRMRKFRNMSSSDKFDKTLIINLVKCDLLQNLFDDKIFEENYYYRDPESKEFKLDFCKVIDMSFHARSLLQKYCPDFIQVVEGFCCDVYYVFTSSTGNHAEFDPTTGNIGIKPKDIKPLFSELPLMLLLAQQGFIGKYYHEDRTLCDEQIEVIELNDYNKTGDAIIYYNERSDSMEQLPKSFFGCEIYDYYNNCFIKIPGEINYSTKPLKSRKTASQKNKEEYNDYKYSFDLDDNNTLNQKLPQEDDFWDE